MQNNYFPRFKDVFFVFVLIYSPKKSQKNKIKKSEFRDKPQKIAVKIRYKIIQKREKVRLCVSIVITNNMLIFFAAVDSSYFNKQNR